MDAPKGKLIIIGGSVDKGSFTKGTEVLPNQHLPQHLKFFEKGILRRMSTESLKGNDSQI